MNNYDGSILDAPTHREIVEDEVRMKKMIEELTDIENNLFNAVYDGLDMGIYLSQINKIIKRAINTFEEKYPNNFTLEK